MNNSTFIGIDLQASCPFVVSVFFTTTMAVITSAALTGNILVFVAVYKTPSLRTSTNYYYVNMAVSDLLSCFTIWPVYLTDDSSGSRLQSSLIGCKLAIFFRVVSTTVSVLSLLLIAVDRYVATVFPLKAKFITRKLRAILLFATWLISVVYSIPMFYFFKTIKIGQETYCTSAWNDFTVIIYCITGIVLLHGLPLIAITVLYYRVMRTLRRSLILDSAQCNARRGNTQDNRNKQNQNIMNIFKSIVVVLFIWFSMFSLYMFLLLFSPDLFIKDSCQLFEGFAFYLIPTFSTATNPVILFAFSSNFRKTLPRWRTFQCRSFCSCCKGKTVPLQNDNISLPELVSYRKTPC